MPIKYRLVLRKRRDQGSRRRLQVVLRREQVHRHLRFRGAVRDQIADRSTASPGDVQVVVDGLLYILKQRSPERRPSAGRSRPLQAVIGSKGTSWRPTSTPPYQTSRIVFRPSVTLKASPASPVREDRARRTAGGGDSESPTKSDSALPR